MQTIQIQIIETLIVLVSTLILNRITSVLLKKISSNFEFQHERLRLIVKIKNILVNIIAGVFILTIWSVNQDQILVFVTSFLTILGITLFAQWSLLCNITSGIILFVNHPTKIGDHITILDKEYNISGIISDIGLFFIIIKTDEDEKVTIPNSIMLQKMIKLDNVKRIE